MRASQVASGAGDLLDEAKGVLWVAAMSVGRDRGLCAGSTSVENPARQLQRPGSLFRLSHAMRCASIRAALLLQIRCVY
jgi:hypothetical protein